jgi:hypothetical protein
MKKILSSTLLCTIILLADIPVGENFPDTLFTDQFGHQSKVSSKDRWICMVFEKNVSVTLTNKVKSIKKGFLDTHHVKIISDISSMPSFITKMFALPMMKKYPFSVWLIQDDSGKQYNRKKGHVTLYHLKNKKVISVTYIKPDKIDRYIDK